MTPRTAVQPKSHSLSSSGVCASTESPLARGDSVARSRRARDDAGSTAVRTEARSAVLISAGALLWIATTALAWIGHWFAGMFALLALMACYGLLGITRDGRTSRRLLWFPLVCFLGIWAAGFALAQHEATRFADGGADHTVFGFHPSFAWIVIAYWLGGTLVMTLGFYLRRDSWLSEARWQAFLDAVRDVERESGER